MWDNYEIATKLKEQDKEQRISTLLVCIGAEALEIYYGLPWEVTVDAEGQVTKDKARDIDVVLEKLEKYCTGETNEIYEQYCFNKRAQQENETIDAYVTVLRTLAQTCNFSTLESSLIRNRIVIGIRDNNTRKRLLQTPKLDLKTCLDICRAYEATAHQLKDMSGGQEEPEEVSIVKISKLGLELLRESHPMVSRILGPCLVDTVAELTADVGIAAQHGARHAMHVVTATISVPSVLPSPEANQRSTWYKVRSQRIQRTIYPQLTSKST